MRVFTALKGLRLQNGSFSLGFLQKNLPKIYYWDKLGKKQKQFLLKRSNSNIDEIKKTAAGVIAKVRKNGDAALLEFTVKFDKIRLSEEQLRVSEKEFRQAFRRIDKKLLDAIKRQISYSRAFALETAQLGKSTWKKQFLKGVVLGQKTTAIDSVGLYVPGGTAAYPTVMQILAVPAKIAGVKRIVAVTPPRPDLTALLVAARLAGVDEVYRVGGIQAIAALAYGTETIPKVQKIVGPGNVYITAAKELVWGEVAVDMPAGPSEAIILADGSANPVYCAADILARAEHDRNAAGVLVTNSGRLAFKTQKEIARQFEMLGRKNIIAGSLAKYSAIIVTKTMKEAVELTNEYAPEHLEIMTRQPWKTFEGIRNAGSVFLGKNAPVAVGDYASGVNHVLPTGGNAKMFSGIGVETFQKKTEFEFLTKEGLRGLRPIVERISDYEGLPAHKKSVQIRFENNAETKSGKSSSGKSWRRKKGNSGKNQART